MWKGVKIIYPVKMLYLIIIGKLSHWFDWKVTIVKYYFKFAKITPRY